MILHNKQVVDYLQHLVGWYDATLNADHWVVLTDITPTDAAMLLCRHNPLEERWDRLSDDKTGSTSYDNGKAYTPLDLRMLAQRLAAINTTDPRLRTLRDWHQAAIDNGLVYHSWIDGYMEATALVAPPLADIAPLEPQAAPVGDVATNYRDRGNVMQKRALIAKYRSEWDSMESCFKNAHANGLRSAAKSIVRGEWFERDAVAWAKKQGNMKDEKDSEGISLGSVWPART